MLLKSVEKFEQNTKKSYSDSRLSYGERNVNNNCYLCVSPLLTELWTPNYGSNLGVQLLQY